MSILEYGLKISIKFILALLVIFLFILLPNNIYVKADNIGIDITTTNVKDDLASMKMDDLSYYSETEYLFITMAQYYDTENKLRSYVYLNLPDDAYDEYHEDNPYYIRLSVSVMDENKNLNEVFEDYVLDYVNHENTWFKLEVLGLKNLDSTTRRYNIDRIGYHFGGSIISSRIDVNQTFIFNGVSNNTIEIFHQEVETIDTSDFIVYFYRYGDEFDYFGVWDTGLTEYNTKYNDTWYIFFNTERPIGELISCVITYQRFDFSLTNQTTTIDKEYKESVVLEEIEKQTSFPIYASEELNYISYYRQDEVVVPAGSKKVYSEKQNIWGNYVTEYEELDNILNMKEYKAKDSDKFIFTKWSDRYDWGVHFLDTTFCNKQEGNYDYVLTGSGVKNSAVLQLCYELNGKRYNAYAVSIPTDDFTGEGVDSSDDEYKKILDLFEKITTIIGVLILIVILGFCAPIFKIIIDLIISGIKLLFELIIMIITFPFKIIGSLFK